MVHFPFFYFLRGDALNSLHSVRCYTVNLRSSVWTLIFVLSGSIKIYFSQFSLLVGLGAHEYAIANNIVTVDPFNLISGTVIFSTIFHSICCVFYEYIVILF